MKKLLPFFLLLLLLTGCGEDKKTTDTIFAMDTVMTLTVYESGPDADMILSDCGRIIYALEDTLSVTDPESEISRLNQGDRDALSHDTYGLLVDALSIAFATEGAYDPTVYALMDLWGFYDDDYSVPTEEELQAALSHTGHTKADLLGGRRIYLPEGTGVDLGGIAKGYAAQEVIRTIATKDVAAIISLGGNVGIHGTKPDGSDWVVAVEKPDGSGETIATMSIPGAYERYVVTSGAYQRYFEADGKRYHHILDPETGYPAETDLLSVTVVCDNGPRADALSTALFVMGYEKAVEYWKLCRNDTDPIEVVLIREDGIFASPDLNITSNEPVYLLGETP